MSHQAAIDIDSRLTDFKRQQFRRQTSTTWLCQDCTEAPFSTEDELWDHISTKHPQDIPRDEVAAGKFRELKLRDSKTNHSTPHIQWETRMANRKKDSVPDPVSTAARSRTFNLPDVTPPMDTRDPGNRSPKRSAPENAEVSSPKGRAHPQPKRTRGGPRTNTRQNSFDPEFSRALPHVKEQPEETRPQIQRRLFNHNVDDVRTFNPNPMQNASGEPVHRDSLSTHMTENRQELSIIQHPQPRRPPPITIAQRPDPIRQGPSLEEAPVLESPPLKGSPNPPDESDARLAVIREPITRPISPDQLVAEVRGIYAGLIMVERKCCEVDERQHQAALKGDDKPLNIQQWQALIALHRTLLHEHHDFLLASQHPSAEPALRKLAQKYAMPARMWRHAIHSFLELLRHRLPESMEHMLTFIYMSYSMMTLLYETVPTFRDTWIECLGDLARYRMAIEDERKRNNMRDVWKNVARQWYSMAADRTPEVGRLYHHLAILARSGISSARLNILSELFYYCKSLSVGLPFTAARESILTVFDSIEHPEMMMVSRTQPLEVAFVQLHKMGFTQVGLERFEDILEQFITLLDKAHADKQSERGSSRWRTQACFMAVCNIAGLSQYGSRGNALKRACKEGRKQKNEQVAAGQDAGTNSGVVDDDCVIEGAAAASEMDPADELERKYDPEASHDLTGVPQSEEVSMSFSKRLAFKILELVLEQLGEPSPHVYAFMIFILHLADCGAMSLIENELPWEPLVDMLNHLLTMADGKTEAVGKKEFPISERPLSEDYYLRGLEWSKTILTDEYFAAVEVDPEERHLELAGMIELRRDRICWFGVRLASLDDYLVYDAVAQQFTVHPALLARIQLAKEKEAIVLKQPEVSIHDDEDIEMNAAPYSYSEDEGYVLVPEPLRRLKQQKAELEAQLASNTGSVDLNPKSHTGKSRSSKIKGAEALKKGYTAFVIDTNLLVSFPETFNKIVGDGWSVIVPNCVIIELNGLKRNSNTRKAAIRAEEAVANAITERYDVKIITAMGSDVTGKGPYKEMIRREDDESNIDDVISRTAKAQLDLRLKKFGPSGVAEPIFLVTEDTNLRVKARAKGLAAISAKDLKHYLLDQLDRRMDSVSHPAAISAVEPRIKQEEDIEDLAMIDPAPDPKHARGRNRRGRSNHRPSFA